MPPIKQVQANHAVSARARKKRKKKEELSWFHLQLEASYTQIKPSEAALALQSPVMTVPVSENEARDFRGQVRTEQDIASIEIQDPFFGISVWRNINAVKLRLWQLHARLLHQK